MINGETKTRITLFEMDDGVDSGLIARQKEESIYPDDTIAMLYARIYHCGVDGPMRYCRRLQMAQRLHLKDETKRRTMPRSSPENGLIDWTKDAAIIDRLNRVQTRLHPWHLPLCRVNLCIFGTQTW